MWVPRPTDQGSNAFDALPPPPPGEASWQMRTAPERPKPHFVWIWVVSNGTWDGALHAAITHTLGHPVQHHLGRGGI